MNKLMEIKEEPSTCDSKPNQEILKGELSEEPDADFILPNDLESLEWEEDGPVSQESTLSNQTSNMAPVLIRMNYYTCSVCRNIYTSTSQLNAHMEKEHFTSYQTCPTCFLQFRNPQAFSSHVDSHSHKNSQNDKHFKCEQANCPKTFKWKWNLTRHLKFHSNSLRLFTCEYCEVCICNEEDYKFHIENQSSRDGCCVSEPEVKCNFCDKVVGSLKSRIRHRFSTNCHQHKHNPSMKVKAKARKKDACKECNKTFWSNFELKRHTRFYHLKNQTKNLKPNPIESEIEKETKTNVEVQENVPEKTLKKMKFKRHECSECGKRFHTNVELKQHFLIHLTKEQIIMEIESLKKGIIPSRLKVPPMPMPKKKEPPKKPEEEIEIDIVQGIPKTNDYSMQTLDALVAFHRKELSEKAKITKKVKEYFYCLPCLKIFIDEGGLARHNKSYHPNESEEGGESVGTETDWFCSECNKTFSTNWNYSRHFRNSKVHNKSKGDLRMKQKLYCLPCNKTFSKLQHFKYHNAAFHDKNLKKIENGKNFHCIPCKKSFTRMQNLKYHNVAFHDAESDLKLKKKNRYCSTCNKTFSRNDALQRHIKTVHNKKMDQNQMEAENSKDDQRNVDNDKTGQRQSKKHFCSQCDKAFSKVYTYTYHMMNFHKKPGNVNDDCKDSDQTHDSFDLEFKRRMKNNLYCSLCDKTFSKMQRLKSHNAVFHKESVKVIPQENLYCCSKCNKTFSSNKALKCHNFKSHDESVEEIATVVEDEEQVCHVELLMDIKFEPEEVEIGLEVMEKNAAKPKKKPVKDNLNEFSLENLDALVNLNKKRKISKKAVGSKSKSSKMGLDQSRKIIETEVQEEQVKLQEVKVDICLELMEKKESQPEVVKDNLTEFSLENLDALVNLNKKRKISKKAVGSKSKSSEVSLDNQSRKIIKTEVKEKQVELPTANQIKLEVEKTDDGVQMDIREEFKYTEEDNCSEMPSKVKPEVAINKVNEFSLENLDALANVKRKKVLNYERNYRRKKKSSKSSMSSQAVNLDEMSEKEIKTEVEDFHINIKSEELDVIVKMEEETQEFE